MTRSHIGGQGELFTAAVADNYCIAQNFDGGKV